MSRRRRDNAQANASMASQTALACDGAAVLAEAGAINTELWLLQVGMSRANLGMRVLVRALAAADARIRDRTGMEWAGPVQRTLMQQELALLEDTMRPVLEAGALEVRAWQQAIGEFTQRKHIAL